MGKIQTERYNRSRKYRKCDFCKRDRRTTSKKQRFLCKSCKGGVLRILESEKGVKNFPQGSPKLKDLIIMDFLNEHPESTVDNIFTDKNIPKSSIYSSLAFLRLNNILTNNGMLYSLTTHGKNIILNLRGQGLNLGVLRNQNEDNRGLRFHKLQGMYNVSVPIPNFQNYLNKPLKFGKTFPLGRTKSQLGLKFAIDSYMVTICNKSSICVAFPDIIIPEITKEGVGKGYLFIGEMIDNFAEELQRVFNGLVIDSFTPFELSPFHIAIRNSRYAQKYYNKHGEHLRDGNIFTDKSHGKFELEAEGINAGQDILQCIQMENKIEQLL